MPRKKQTEKTWRFTKTRGLLQNTKSGSYYSRITIGGKQIWKSHKTDVFSIAELRHADWVKEQRGAAGDGALDTGRITVKELLDKHREWIALTKDMKPNTKRYRSDALDRIEETWPEGLPRNVRSITSADLRRWYDRFRKRYSISTANGAVVALRAAFKEAVEARIRADNPVLGLKVRQVPMKDLNLPSFTEFQKLLEVVERRGRGTGVESADFIRGLAFSGMRKGEAKWLRWEHINFDSGYIKVVGDPVHGTKGGRAKTGSKGERLVPLIPPMREMLLRRKADFYEGNPKDFVFSVEHVSEGLSSSCKELGLPRMTMHDLRHYFITTAVEAGVPIPVIALAVGHKDGGALLMQRYSHPELERNREYFERLTFGQAPKLEVVKPAEVA